MPQPVGSGLAPGIVTDCFDPQGRGKVRVSFPWLDDQVVSDWIPVIVPIGFDPDAISAVPIVGAAVFVGFLHGDFNQPIVLGQALGGH